MAHVNLTGGLVIYLRNLLFIQMHLSEVGPCGIHWAVYTMVLNLTCVKPTSRRLISFFNFHLHVTTALEFFVHPIALKSRDLKVNSSELCNISNSQPVSLIFGAEVFKNLIDRCLFPNNQPHRPLKINVIFFVFFSILLLPAVINSVLCDTKAKRVGNLSE